MKEVTNKLDFVTGGDDQIEPVIKGEILGKIDVLSPIGQKASAGDLAKKNIIWYWVKILETEIEGKAYYNSNKSNYSLKNGDIVSLNKIDNDYEITGLYLQ